MMIRSPALLRTLGERLDPRHCALLIIDMQNDFCAPGGYVETVIGRDASPCRVVVDPIIDLVDLARDAGVRVIWVVANYDAEAIPSPMRTKQLDKGEAVCCVTGSWGAEFFGVTPAADEMVLAKNTYSAFVGTGLAEILTTDEIRTVVFAGIQTNVCVENSVRDAFCMGFYCVVAGDCVASHTAPLHDAALTNIRFLYGDVVDRGGIARVWLGGVSGAA